MRFSPLVLVLILSVVLLEVPRPSEAHVLTQRSATPRASSPSAVTPRVDFLPIRPYGTRYTLRLLQDGQRIRVIILTDLGEPDRIIVQRPHRRIVTLSHLLYGITALGTVSLEGRGPDRAVIIGKGGGTGASQVAIHLLHPRIPAVIGLTLDFSHRLTDPIPEMTMTPNFRQPRFRKERAVLDRLKYAYGYLNARMIAKRRADPELAYYFWAQANGSLTNGRMRIRRYPGRPTHTPSITAEVRAGAVRYRAYFRAGVIAYARQANVHYVLYHPDWMFHWPTALRLVGRTLIICHGNARLATVDTRTFYLIQYEDLSHACSSPREDVGGGEPRP